jgi:hypothetical protein
LSDVALESRLVLSTVHAHVASIHPVVHETAAKKSDAFDATGSAFRTTLGTSSKTVSFTNQLSLVSPQLGTFQGTSSATYTVKSRIAKGVETYTASNGSTLKLQIEGKFGPLGANDLSIGSYKVIGGTGIYAHASGKGTFIALPIGPDGSRAIGYSGTLKY